MPLFDFEAVTNGNPEAKACLVAWGAYVRLVDNIVDDNLWDAEHLISAFATGAQFYSSKFYRQHISTLQMPILNATSLWAISADWERQSELWKRQFADVLRHSDVAVVGAVALICLGWERMQDVSRAFLCAGFAEHRDKYGVPC